MRCYVLVRVDVHAAREAEKALRAMAIDGSRVLSVDTVTGPYDLIMSLEADDLDTLGRVVTEGIQAAPGVRHTTSCLAVTLA